MPRVTVFQGGNIQRDEPRVVPLRAADFGGSPVGEGLQALGRVGAEAADTINGIAALHDEAAVKEATNKINAWYAEAAYTGSNAFFSKQGRDALDTRPMIDKGLTELVKQTRSGLQNPRQQRMFDQAVVPQQQQWQINIAQHAAKETVAYNVDESKSRAAMTGELARYTYIDNPTEGEEHIATGLAEVENSLHLQGAGPDQIAEAKLKYSSGIYSDIGKRLVYSGPDGPKLAQAFIDKHGESMTGDDREALLTTARVYQNSLEAEQGRVEAEQRRLANEAKRDARDRVTSAMSRIDDGLPLSPDEYSSAVADAKLTEDPNLIKRVKEGQFKNNLTLQYRNATPVELQNRVNELSTSISKAGAKAKPEEIVERDHLQSMLNTSKAGLQSDALSWGAEHLGIQVGALNLDDPSSITARINAATAVAKQTGRTVAPFTSSEAATLSSQMQSNTTGQSAALALKLARFGPLAETAARQISNNTAFVASVGLATNRNRGVAASRVNQIFTGFDVLKGKPKLIDKDESRRQFEQYVGQSLQFFPDTKNGVYSNAAALLATEANQHGWNEWGEIDGRAWFRAVNSALGAYTNEKGEQVGGLHGLNGGITVLPEDMSETDFDERISRSRAEDFRKAANGIPVYANGESPYSGDIKKMQWIPSGDGIYRLSDGHGFLHTKEGGFYEIDVRKLPSGFDAQLAAHGYTRR